jgi:upstream activation factor subunit UAF30
MKKNNICHHECQLTEELSSLMGQKCIDKKYPRYKIVEKIWEIIKKEDLFDPEDRRYILSNAKLRKIFPKRFYGFDMAKYIEVHIIC